MLKESETTNEFVDWYANNILNGELRVLVENIMLESLPTQYVKERTTALFFLIFRTYGPWLALTIICVMCDLREVVQDDD
jgi:hypothetical protein